MKTLKKSLLALCLSVFGYANAQFTLLTVGGDVIEDNHTVTYNVVGNLQDDTASFKFQIKNENSFPILLKGEVVEMEGADGTNVQFCMGDCLNSVQVGTLVPGTGGYQIAANSLSSEYGSYFKNMNEAGSDYKKYRFKIYQIDNFGNQTGEAIHIDYIYNKTVSVQDIQQHGFDIYPTVVKNQFTIELLDNADVEVVNIQGKVIKKMKLSQGANVVDIDGFNSGVYFVRVVGKANAIKIVKQ
ncbi:MAG: T9SS type A sorting domain-containing protein [Bacteroidota bacterium]|nr:T9SS type A sorting domain-containing protein [Bacteroidota bacterium]